MRAVDQQIQVSSAYLGGNGTAPGFTWTSPSGGSYELRLTEAGAKLVGVMPEPAGGGSSQFTLGLAANETPPRATVTFLSATGAAGAYGGNVQVLWKRPA